ncbi:MBL fold metallo-hydrolase [Cohnella lupini]|nr:MBL fold metallo-hydrolase [Cohnella lupini]
MKPFSESRHFRMERVADGVFAAISKPGTGSLGNAAIIDLGDATLVVDTMLTLEAARDLRDAAESLFGKPVSYVFNTHWHVDHTFGNQVFAPAAQIISTSKTRQMMSTLLKERIAQHLAQPDEFYQELQPIEEKIREEKDDKLRLEMQLDVGYDREYIKGLPDIILTLPSITFEHDLTLHGSRRSVQLITYGGGHSECDAFVYLPDEQTAVMGDLVFSGQHPVMRRADPDQWISILDRVEELDLETIVPGHGDVGTLEALRQVREYITEMTAIAEKLVRHNRTAEDAAIPEKYRDWHFTSDFKVNLQRLIELMGERI